VGHEIEEFNIETLRMQLRAQQGDEPFKAGQRINGSTAETLNRLHRLFNALALHQGQSQYVIALDEPEAPAPRRNRHLPVLDDGTLVIEANDAGEVAAIELSPRDQILFAQALIDADRKE
jgi:hypothetical protein